MFESVVTPAGPDVPVSSLPFLKCSYCEYSTQLRGVLTVHEAQHLAALPYGCAHCDFRTAYRSVAGEHERLHDPYDCEQCDFRTVDADELALHVRLHKDDELIATCKLCAFSGTREELDAHDVAMHGGGKAHKHRCGRISARAPYVRVPLVTIVYYFLKLFHYEPHGCEGVRGLTPTRPAPRAPLAPGMPHAPYSLRAARFAAAVVACTVRMAFSLLTWLVIRSLALTTRIPRSSRAHSARTLHRGKTV
jgi:hypothetical protein